MSNFVKDHIRKFQYQDVICSSILLINIIISSFHIKQAVRCVHKQFAHLIVCAILQTRTRYEMKFQMISTVLNFESLKQNLVIKFFRNTLKVLVFLITIYFLNFNVHI